MVLTLPGEMGERFKALAHRQRVRCRSGFRSAISIYASDASKEEWKVNPWDRFVVTIVLAIVQGLSEFLPISSSGHLILRAPLSRLAGLEVFAFDVAIHMGTLLVVVSYRQKKAMATMRIDAPLRVCFTVRSAVVVLAASPGTSRRPVARRSHRDELKRSSSRHGSAGHPRCTWPIVHPCRDGCDLDASRHAGPSAGQGAALSGRRAPA